MKSIWRVITYSKQLWRYYAAISVFTILLSLMGLLQPLLSGFAIDEISKGSAADIKTVVIIATLIFILEVLGTLFSNIGGYIGDQMAAKLQMFLSLNYYKHLMDLPQSYYDKELTGTIINRLNRSITQITSFMQMMSNNFLQFIFSTIFALVVVAFYSWQVALLLFSLYPIYIYLTLKTSNTWLIYQAKKNKLLDIATGRFAEAINQIKVVKSYVQEKQELSFFKENLSKYVSVNKPQSRFWHERDIQRRLILNVIFYGVYLFIFVQAANGMYSPGVAVALILYAMQIRIPIFTISYLVENTQKAVADSKDYFNVIETPVEEVTHSSKKLTPTKGAIEFTKVNFGYDRNDVLKGITFNIKGGEKLALVGESGEGKTTITSILIGLYRPSSGEIKIDGFNIDEVSQQSLRESISVVFQDPALFSGTIYENIAYAKPNAKKSDVEKAAIAANAHEFISNFENGYQTQIGERGLKLSGGQKQRIAIARALLKNAPILILDEATSSLDSKSEMLVQDALGRLMKGRTTLIIAHRLTTISHVDTIVTIKKGKVDEIGTPQELAKSGGIYDQLLQISNLSDESAKKRLIKYDIAN
jgi:ATP-binding cassette, subfamily B, bacterial